MPEREQPRLEIEPEPTEEERAAIIGAVGRLVAERDTAPGAWWAAGLPDAEDGER